MGEGFRNLPDRLGVRFMVALASLATLDMPDPARAFDFSSLDFFGLWSSRETAPPVSPTALPYMVTIDVAGGDRGLARRGEGRFVALQAHQGRPS